MKLSELISRVQNLYSRGVESDDTALSPRHIYNKLLSVRSLLITQKINKKRRLGDWAYQLLPCVEMIEVDSSLCPCSPPSGCTVKRSKLPLPKALNSIFSPGVEGVYTSDFSRRFSHTTRKSLEYIKGNRYTKKGDKYIIENDYLYAYGESIPKILMVKLLLENPLEDISSYDCSSFSRAQLGECKSPLDLDFPLDPEMIEPLIQMTSQELVVDFSRIQKDNKTTDNEDNRA